MDSSSFSLSRHGYKMVDLGGSFSLTVLVAVVVVVSLLDFISYKFTDLSS